MHRWRFSTLGSIRNLAKTERCRKCGKLRKVRGRHWRYQWLKGDWHRAASACGGDTAKDDRQRELFSAKGEVKA